MTSTSTANGESAQSGTAADGRGSQTTLAEIAQASAQASEAAATPEMLFAESGVEVDETVEALEDLILEAYNNMQIDGEYIFLPEEVAEKLHRVAEQTKMQESGEEEQTENNTSAGEDSNSGDAVTNQAEVEEVKTPQQETPTDLPEPEQETEQEQVQNTEKEPVHMTEEVNVHKQHSNEDEEVRLRKVQALQAEAAELREEKHKRRIPRVASTENLFTELAPVPEIDESASSGPPSPSPPHSRSHSGANTPKPRAQAAARGHGHFPPPPLISLSSTPSSVAASPNQIGKSPASKTPDQSVGSKRKSKVLTYEKRREATLKLKEEKKMRELRNRESARKIREDSKRQLEEAHQREMEERRDRMRRIREEKLHRRTGKASGVHGAKKDG